MTVFEEQCQAFGSIIDDIQSCNDPEQLRQLMTTGFTSLLVMRNLGFTLFDATEQCKSAAESARKAFDEKTLVLQNILYENGYYQKEINEARNYRSSVSDSEMELVPTDSFLQTTSADLHSSLDRTAADYEHQLLLKRLEHELQARKQARQQLSELKVRRDAMHASLGLKRKAVDDLNEHVSHIKAAAAPVRELLPQSDTAIPEQQQLAQLLPLPLYMIFSQTTAILHLLEASIGMEVHGSAELAQDDLIAAANSAAAQRNSKRQKRDGSVEPPAETDLHKVFPLSVQLHLKDAGVSVSFFYLPAVGIVTAEASTKAGNAMLASLFQRDTGKDAPSEANHYIGQGTFDLDPQATARPYRWAQWLAGLDFLPALPTGLVLQGEVHHSAVQRGLTQYRKEKRAMHVLHTLLRRAEQTLILQTELAQLMSKSVPIPFPNRHFQQVPGGTISLQETSERQMAQAMPQAAETVPEADEDEEGEVQEVEPSSDPQKDSGAAQSMQVDGVVKEEEGQEEPPVPLLSASEEDSKEGKSSGLSQDAGVGYRFFKLHLKSPTGWQIDAQVRIPCLYPTSTPQVLIVNVKEGFSPSVTHSARKQMSAEQITALQKQVQQFAGELDADERQQVLSYQLVFLLKSLNEQTAGLKTVNVAPARAASRPGSAATQQPGVGINRGRAR